MIYFVHTTSDIDTPLLSGQSRTATRYLTTSNANIDQCVRFELQKRDRENTKIHYFGLSEVNKKEEEEEKSLNKEVK